jgi:predicted RNA-binding Zn-ribbon protein involved in translation (DUF1610 family)
MKAGTKESEKYCCHNCGNKKIGFVRCLRTLSNADYNIFWCNDCGDIVIFSDSRVPTLGLQKELQKSFPLSESSLPEDLGKKIDEVIIRLREKHAQATIAATNLRQSRQMCK